MKTPAIKLDSSFHSTGENVHSYIFTSHVNMSIVRLFSKQNKEAWLQKECRRRPPSHPNCKLATSTTEKW